MICVIGSNGFVGKSFCKFLIKNNISFKYTSFKKTIDEVAAL